ncbi:MAG: exosortase-associated EpsI family protein [Planctomycetia bacterium]|nr:exosortase-associated EpsI family protein [Planctomycetia bacterium]
MNKQTALWIPVGVAAVMVIASSIVQGYWTNRFGAKSDSQIVKEFAQNLERVPKVIGEWEAVDHPMNAQEQEVAGIVGYVSREYRNPRTDESVTVMLVCGNFRNIAKHEPTQCYVAAGYNQEKEVEQYETKTKTSVANFNTTVFKLEDEKKLERLRIFWSWNYDGDWVSPTYARWSLRGLPALYKLYIISQVRPGEDLEGSTAFRFIQDLIPELDKRLFVAPPAEGAKTPAKPIAEKPAEKA